MISFYPGPSRLNPNIAQYLQDAVEDGILSVNHRSPEFEALSQKTLRLLKEKLDIPQDYTIFFTSSATECWEILAQSLIDPSSFSVHLFNGAFGEKWFQQTHYLRPFALGKPFALEDTLTSANFKGLEKAGLIAITQNETSNGTAVSNESLSTFRKMYSNSLLAVDATSSMGGAYLDFNQADCWFASVQKCFGLPAGLALLICSPKAIEAAYNQNETSHYNSLINMAERMKYAQTTHTPNVLAIYLLAKVLENSPFIEAIDRRVSASAKSWYDFFSSSSKLEILVYTESLRSTTVIALKGDPSYLSIVKEVAKKQGLLLGNGYGAWKSSTVRIANFPAIQEVEQNVLKDFFKEFI